MRISIFPGKHRTGHMTGAVSCRGFSLVELLIVTALLAGMSILVSPYLRTPPSNKLISASDRLADMFRYARDKAIATAQPHAVSVLELDNAMLFQLIVDNGSGPVVVEHPIRHDPYQLVVSTRPARRTASVSLAELGFDGPCEGAVAHIVAFDGHGMPRCVMPYTTLMESAVVTLSLGDDDRTVTIEPITGRVVQL